MSEVPPGSEWEEAVTASDLYGILANVMAEFGREFREQLDYVGTTLEPASRTEREHGIRHGGLVVQMRSGSYRVRIERE